MVDAPDRAADLYGQSSVYEWVGCAAWTGVAGGLPFGPVAMWCGSVWAASRERGSGGAAEGPGEAAATVGLSARSPRPPWLLLRVRRRTACVELSDGKRLRSGAIGADPATDGDGDV